jgi:hypothetical protein
MVGARHDGGGVTTESLSVAVVGPSARPRGPAAGAQAALRLAVWTVVWATILRNIGASVGVWAGGALGATVTIAISVVIPAWLFVFFPSWLAWRVAQPLGMPVVAAIACWMSPLVRLRDLPGVSVFMAIAAGRPFPAGGALAADAWIALAAALQGDGGRGTRAARIADALAHLPAGARFPRLARSHGVETLMLAALRRRDFAAAARWAELGRGRLVGLLASIARAGTGTAVPARALWLRWALAPARRATLPLVRQVTRPRPPTSLPSDAAAPVALPVHRRHVALIAAAARNQPIAARDVAALAAAWRPALDEAAAARVQARALALDVRDGPAQARALRARVLDELAALFAASHGQGMAPAGTDPFHADLASRVRQQQLDDVRTALRALDPDTELPPLEAWERWLALRAVLERIDAQGGREASAALWHGGVRDPLWRWSCALFRAHGPRAAWVALAIFDWVANRAEYVGDMVAMLANRESARAALATLR